jgi:hypothetical protein
LFSKRQQQWCSVAWRSAYIRILLNDSPNGPPKEKCSVKKVMRNRVIHSELPKIKNSTLVIHSHVNPCCTVQVG